MAPGDLRQWAVSVRVRGGSRASGVAGSLFPRQGNEAVTTAALLDSYYTLCACGLAVVQVWKAQTQVWKQS